MALVAGSIAALGSELSVAGVMNFGFELQPSLHPMLWIALPVLTFITLAAASELSVEVRLAAVPVPATGALLLTALGAGIALRRRA